MITDVPLPFISEYINQLKKNLPQKSTLTKLQASFLEFSMMGILTTNTVAWKKFERASLNKRSKQQLSKMYLHAGIDWSQLLTTSSLAILKKYGIQKASLLIDDKDHARSKNAKNIHALHKMKDKTSGGYVLGQNIVLLYLVTEKFCLPISFEFYKPDPAISAWTKEDKRLRSLGISKKNRPKCPESNSLKKSELAIKLVKEFAVNFPHIDVNAVLADALYGTAEFMDSIEAILPNTQVISQIRSNQNIIFNHKKTSCKKHFESYQGWDHAVSIRGQTPVKVIAGGARVIVSAHGKKRFVIALKYEGEEEYRYLIASNLPWNMTNIIETYTLRWFIEVFFEDWSQYCGFCSMAKQCGVKGSERTLILSLLFDHCFLFHFRQELFIKNKLPLATLGSLVEQSRFDALLQFMKDVISSDNPKERLNELEKISEDVFILRKSKKHLSGTNKTLYSQDKKAA